MNEDRQVCRICNLSLPLDDFYIDQHSNTGYKSACKSCIKAGQQRDRDITKGKLCKNCLAPLTPEARNADRRA